MCVNKSANFLLFQFLFALGVRCEISDYKDTFSENLFLKPLPSGHVYSQFKFLVKWELDGDNIFQHFHLFPRSFGEILVQHQVQELHFSLTQGLWRTEKWGYADRPSPPGAELWALFKDTASDISAHWKNLTNVLSGQFCASLNFVDDSNTVIPKLSFKPEGAILNTLPYNLSLVRYAALPRENVCTENLTPFRKLLPCGSQAGLSTLVNALHVFNAHYISLAVDVQPVCLDECTKAAVELIQSITVVFDPPSKQPMHQDWSFVKLFGTSLTSTCALAYKSQVIVDTTSNKTGVPFILTAEPTEWITKEIELENKIPEKENFAVYDLKEWFKIHRYCNIGSTYKSRHIYGLIPPPIFHAERRLTGYGQENGGINCIFYNNHYNKSLKILYFDMIPWYLRLYSHTLLIKSNNKVKIPDFLYYEPARDRFRPHHLELVLTLAPMSKTEVSMEFDFAFLKWTEYPPDANHGFYIGSAAITTVLDDGRNQSFFTTTENIRNEQGYFLRMYTQTLLISLPTPDFSMPYNVICLTCTVVALVFGPIHSITTKSLQPLEDDQSTFVSKFKKKLKNWWKTKEKDQENSSDAQEGDTKKSQ